MTKDIEREAFEAWHYEQYLLENPNMDISNAKYIYDYAHKNVLVCQLRESHFTAWQAAKAHKAEKLKGKVVVPVEPTPKMIDSTWDDQDEIETMSHNSRNEFIYKKMIRVAMVEAARGGNE